MKILAHDECFSKLADLLAEDVPELGSPPKRRISIVNRNALIPGFWVDPLEYRGIEWRKFIDALHNKIQHYHKIELHLHVPSTADKEYFDVMEYLSELSVKNILSHLNNGNFNKAYKNNKYSNIAKGKLPTCYGSSLKLLGKKDGDM